MQIRRENREKYKQTKKREKCERERYIKLRERETEKAMNLLRKRK